MNKLDGVHPKLATQVQTILDVMRTLGYPMMVTDGVRSMAQQWDLYARGRTEPGLIVTNCDGIRKRSPHQPRDDGYGHAVDCCFVIDGKPSWDARLPWKCFGEIAKTLGLTWGGEFHSLVDLPHVELP